MGEYRSKLDIIADMLRVASNGANKTKIMYQANLSYKLLTKYLKELVKAELVHFQRTESSYVLTQKGLEFLQRYKEYSRRNKHIEKQFNDLHNKRKALTDLLMTQ
ncbi:MAG: winged helix-turn-helix domain-containing protein [Candidatus Bathyarchaeia archaeon]